MWQLCWLYLILEQGKNQWYVQKYPLTLRKKKCKDCAALRECSNICIIHLALITTLSSRETLQHCQNVLLIVSMFYRSNHCPCFTGRISRFRQTAGMSAQCTGVWSIPPWDTNAHGCFQIRSSTVSAQPLNKYTAVRKDWTYESGIVMPNVARLLSDLMILLLTKKCHVKCFNFQSPYLSVSCRHTPRDSPKC